MVVRSLKYAVVLAAFAFLIWRADPSDLWRQLSHANAGWALIAVLLNLPIVLIMTLRSFLILRRLGHSIPLPILAPISILGNIAGALTPAASGEVLRAASLRSKAGVPAQDCVALVIYERVGSLYLLGLSTGVVAGFASLPISFAVAIAVLAVALVPFVWVAALVVLPRLPTAGSVGGESFVSGVVRYFLMTVDQLRFLLADLGLLLGTSALTLLIFLLAALQFQVLTRSVAASQPLDEAWIAFGVSQLAGMLSLLPLGLGVSDGSLAATLHRLGTTVDQGAAVAVLVRGAVTLPLALIAFGCYIYLGQQASVVGRDEVPASL